MTILKVFLHPISLCKRWDSLVHTASISETGFVGSFKKVIYQAADQALLKQKSKPIYNLLFNYLERTQLGNRKISPINMQSNSLVLTFTIHETISITHQLLCSKKANLNIEIWLIKIRLIVAEFQVILLLPFLD